MSSGRRKQKSQELEIKRAHCFHFHLNLDMKRRKTYLASLIELGLVQESASLDDVLNLKIEDIIERRLQTVVMRKAKAKSPHQARQIVVHGHVSIGNRIVNLPGYLVKREEEPQILLHAEISLPRSAK